MEFHSAVPPEPVDRREESQQDARNTTALASTVQELQGRAQVGEIRERS